MKQAGARSGPSRRIAARLGVLLLLGACVPETTPSTWRSSVCASTAPWLGRDTSSARRDLRLAMRDGTELAVAMRSPDGESCVGAVVEVPPGFSAGTSGIDGDQAQLLARAGLAVVTFDPRGRGESEGLEDANGPTGQADLAEVLRWTTAQAGIDADALVVWSRSFGGALAGGALGTFDDLQPQAWVDYESPALLATDLLFASEHTQERMFGLADASGDADAWLLERSPAAQITAITTPYHRLQGTPDHALDTMGAAVEMLNAAATSEHILLNGKEMELPVTEEGFRDHVFGGRFDPGGDFATAAVIGGFGE